MPARAISEVPDDADEDIDGDGVSNDIEASQESDPMDPFSCGDIENDSCDDCAIEGSPNILNDGPDFDDDAICDLGDEDDDGDGDNDGEGFYTRCHEHLDFGIRLLFKARTNASTQAYACVCMHCEEWRPEQDYHPDDLSRSGAVH